jgi:hypothetical protein
MTNAERNVDEAAWGETQRTVASLLLIVHVFIVAMCLAANLAPSQFQQRLMSVLRPYAQLLNFELEGTRFYLTRASAGDVDHRIEALPQGEDEQLADNWINLSAGVRGSERYQRYQRLADVMAFFAEDEQTAGLIAQSVAGYYLRQQDVSLRQVRCRSHLLQPWDVMQRGAIEELDPDDPSYFSVLYRADILIGDHRIDVLKRAEAALEAAPE